MIQYDWNDDKNSQFKEARGVCFEQVVLQIAQGGLLDILQHPNAEKYPGQKVLVVRIANYVHAVPFVEDGETRFLKTIIPSRKLTRDYLKADDIEADDE